MADGMELSWLLRLRAQGMLLSWYYQDEGQLANEEQRLFVWVA